MITVKVSGDFTKIERFLANSQRLNLRNILDKYGAKGVAALSSATPIDSGLTAMSWDYRITMSNWGYSIAWFNTNINNGVPVAILIQYGHGTGNGGYVPPYDYINPAMRPIFDEIADDLWKEVSSL